MHSNPNPKTLRSSPSQAGLTGTAGTAGDAAGAAGARAANIPGAEGVELVMSGGRVASAELGIQGAAMLWSSAYSGRLLVVGIHRRL